MGYIIRYGKMNSKERVYSRKKRIQKAVVTCLVVLILLLFTVSNRDGYNWIKQILLPGDADVTGVALSVFAENIRRGESIREAFTAFCMEIIHNAEIY